MFADACVLVRQFMHPVIISVRFYDNTTACDGGNFVVLNEEGWVITVAHLFKSFQAFRQHATEIKDFQTNQQAAQEKPWLTAKQKRKLRHSFKANPRWITNHSFWWGKDGVSIKDIKVLPEADLAVGRLEPFDPTSVKTYPTIKDPTINLNPGTSLCKLGFPFHELKTSFDEKTGNFELPPGILPVPLFPLEGIFTRNVLTGKSNDGRYEIKWLETSSPGLRGHSGGPIFDTKGTVWAIQSRTHHFPLGFSPKVTKDGKEVEEHQFLSVGLGLHPELIVLFLRDNGIKFKLSDY
jgi:hypothetical protein